MAIANFSSWGWCTITVKTILCHSTTSRKQCSQRQSFTESSDNPERRHVVRVQHWENRHQNMKDVKRGTTKRAVRRCGRNLRVAASIASVSDSLGAASTRCCRLFIKRVITKIRTMTLMIWLKIPSRAERHWFDIYRYNHMKCTVSN